jgi:xanthine/CO dehydrogenase XdhC/CoxF family maturation factor
MSLITKPKTLKNKTSRDYACLRAIEKGIEEGESLCVIRVLDKQLDKWRREIIRITPVGESSLKDELHHSALGVINDVCSEMFRSKKLVDLKNLSLEEEVKKVAFEILHEKLNLLVCGAGHVGQAVGLMGSLLGYKVVVADDRPEFAIRSRFPDPRIQLMVGDYSRVLKNIKINSNSAVVIVTRGHQFDEVCLRLLLNSYEGYLGMIGSKRRTISVLNRLRKDGFPEVLCRKVHAPIGLPIGAKSPQEIAVAIHAEIINYFNKNI